MTTSGTDQRLLTAEHLAVRYPTGAMGIIDVSISVHVGQMVALLGPNGAGKTTTARALSGFLRSERARITHGSIKFLDEEIGGLEPYRIARKGIAAVPERNKVFRNMSVQEHFSSIGAHLSRAARRDAVDAALNHFPILRERYRQSAGSLSGGQQQMLAIARALAGRPRLLIIDEMTLGLHPSLHAGLFAAVRDIRAQGTSAIIIDESVTNAVAHADYCYILEAGQIASSGPPEAYDTEGLNQVFAGAGEVGGR